MHSCARPGIAKYLLLRIRLARDPARCLQALLGLCQQGLHAIHATQKPAWMAGQHSRDWLRAPQSDIMSKCGWTRPWSIEAAGHTVLKLPGQVVLTTRAATNLTEETSEIKRTRGISILDLHDLQNLRGRDTAAL